MREGIEPDFLEGEAELAQTTEEHPEHGPAPGSERIGELSTPHTRMGCCAGVRPPDEREERAGEEGGDVVVPGYLSYVQRGHGDDGKRSPPDRQQRPQAASR